MVASDFYSLANEPIIITMSHFIAGYYLSFWDEYYRMLIYIDPIAQKSGFMACHMAAVVFLMDQDLLILRNTWQTNTNFKDYLESESNHEKEEVKEVIIQNLPSFF